MISKEKLDFFANEESPIPKKYFKRFNCTSKRLGVSEWSSVLKTVLASNEDPKFTNILKNYNRGLYNKSIDDYFQSSKFILKQARYLYNTESIKLLKTAGKRNAEVLDKQLGAGAESGPDEDDFQTSRRSDIEDDYAEKTTGETLEQCRRDSENSKETENANEYESDTSSDDDFTLIDPFNDSQDKDNEIDKKSDEFTAHDLTLLSNQYKSMLKEKKWRLLSGRYVEDVMYELGKRYKYHHLVHSFIFDVEDKFTCSAFTDEELEEIRTTNLRDSPDLESDLLTFISTFAKTSTKEIRRELNRSHINLGEDYNSNVHHDYDYVKSTVGDWVRLFEKIPLTMNWPEGWYRTNIWRAVDNAFGDIPYIFVVCGETAGVATTERKNRDRMLNNEVSMKRKKIGKKGDGFVRSVGTQAIDWAASEAGPRWEGRSGTKLFKEAGFSLPRQLKDIFVTLARKVDFDEVKIRQLDVPGFVHASAVIMKVNLDCPKGYVLRYVRNDPCEMSAEINEFPKSLDVLVTILYAKATMLRTMNVIKSSGKGLEEAHKRWKRIGEAKRKVDGIELTDCHPTPKKIHKKKL